MTLYTVEVTYLVQINSDEIPAHEVDKNNTEEDWISDNIYHSTDLGMPTEADIVDLEIHMADGDEE